MGGEGSDVESHAVAGAIDGALRLGMAALLVFAPLAFGSVESWSIAASVTAAALLGLLWIAKEAFFPALCHAERERHSCLNGRTAGLFPFFAAIAGLAAVQLLPLGRLVGFFSPGAERIYKLAGLAEGGWSFSLFREGTMAAVAIFGAAVCLFLLALNTSLSRVRIRQLALTMILVGFGLALFGVIQQLTWNGKIFWIHPVKSSNPFGPYVNHNHFAGLMVMVIPFAVGYLFSIGRRRSGASGEKANHRAGLPIEVRPRQALLIFMIAVMVQALLMSLSRGGALAVFLALSLMGLLVGTGKQTRSRFWIWAGSVSFAVAVAFWLGVGKALERLGTLWFIFEDSSAQTRTELWADTVRMFAAMPVFGSGLGSYGSAFDAYQSFTGVRYLRWLYAHSDPLQLLSEGGIIVFGIVLATSILYTRRLWRAVNRRRDREIIYLALGGMTGMTAFVFHTFTTTGFHITANALTFAVLAGLTLKTANSKV